MPFVFFYQFLILTKWSITLFRIGGGGERGTQKGPSHQFLPCNFCKRRSYRGSFDRLAQNFKFLTNASSKLLNLKQHYPSKKPGLVKSLYIWGYDNLSYTNSTVTKLWSHDHIHNIIWVMWQIFGGDVIDRVYDVITFILKYLYFKSWDSHFCWHHQNLNHVIDNNL